MKYFSKIKLIRALIFCLISMVFYLNPAFTDEPPVRKPSQICGDNSLIPIMSAPTTWRNFRTGVAMIVRNGSPEGTGFLYDDCCLVTAGHVIQGATAANIKVWFGYEDITDPYTSGDCTPDVWDCCDLKLNPDGYDVGVVYITKKNGKCPGQSGYGLLPISSVGPQQGWGVHVIGHPQGGCKKYSHDSYATIISNGTDPSCGAGEWSHGADTEGGSSGSPVFDDAGKVIGIHVSADGTSPCKNCFVPTASVYNWLTQQKPCGCQTPQPQCSDGIDNDGNGCADYPTDTGCSSPADDTEAGGTCQTPQPQCSDGIDNDGNGCADYPRDTGCSSPQDNSESGGSCQPSGGAVPTLTPYGFGLLILFVAVTGVWLLRRRLIHKGRIV